MRAVRLLLLPIAACLFGSCSKPDVLEARPADPAAAAATPTPSPMPTPPAPLPDPTAARELATFGGGCFWCTEAVIERLEGVFDVTSGYTGGAVDNPTYDQVCSGTTGHAEVVQVAFDPRRIAYTDLLEWFFRSHDPTTLNRQGPDEGTQYRSAIFFHSPEQRAQALATIGKLQPKYGDPIVTEVTAAGRFWPAEAYHQDYFRNNPTKGYCRAMITPKLQKLGLDRK